MTTDTGTIKAGAPFTGPGFCLSGPGPSYDGNGLTGGQGETPRAGSTPAPVCTFCREPIDLPAGMLGSPYLGPKRAGLPACPPCACRWDADMDRAEQRMARQKAVR